MQRSLKKKHATWLTSYTYTPYPGVMLKLCTASFSASNAFLFSLSLWHCVYFYVSVCVCVLRAGSRALLSLGRPLPQRDAKAHWPICQNQRCVGDSTGVTTTHKTLGQRPVRGGLDGYGPSLCLATTDQRGRWSEVKVNAESLYKCLDM